MTDEVAEYLSPAKGHRNPGNPTGFLAEISKVEPQRVVKYRESIHELRNHEEKYVREHCETILNLVGDVICDPSAGEIFTGRIDRISGSGNGIIKTLDGDINVGPVDRDAVGTEIKARLEWKGLARCLTEGVRGDDYETEYESLINPSDDSPSPSGPLPPIKDQSKESRTTFCDQCGSIMYPGDGKTRICSACGYEEPVADIAEGHGVEKDSSSDDSDENPPVEIDGNPTSQSDTSNDYSSDIESSTEQHIAKRDLDIDELREAAMNSAVEEVPESASVNPERAQEYNRSKEVREYVMARADGVCEGCGESAPFTSKTGEPYLHAHHIHELSNGGSDTPDTVVALCPNCHYRVHHGENGEAYNKNLLEIVKTIESS